MEITTSLGDARSYCTLHFSEISGDLHGPLTCAPDTRVEKIQQWLETGPLKSCCVDDEAHEWLAHVEISTTCGKVLDEWNTLDQYPVGDGDTLWVFVVPREPGSEDFACATEAHRVRAILRVLQVRHRCATTFSR